MKTAHDLVAAARARIQEVALDSAEQAIHAPRGLLDMGYLNVRSIAGGVDAWLAAGMPFAKPELLPFE